MRDICAIFKAQLRCAMLKTLLLLGFDINLLGSIISQTWHCFGHRSFQKSRRDRKPINYYLPFCSQKNPVKNKYCFIVFTGFKNLTEFPLSLFS